MSISTLDTEPSMSPELSQASTLDFSQNRHLLLAHIEQQPLENNRVLLRFIPEKTNRRMPGYLKRLRILENNLKGYSGYERVAPDTESFPTSLEITIRQEEMPTLVAQLQHKMELFSTPEDKKLINESGWLGEGKTLEDTTREYKTPTGNTEKYVDQVTGGPDTVGHSYQI